MSLRVRFDQLTAAARGLSLMGVERLQFGIAFNPLRPELRSDPHPYYRQLRERDPFHRSYAADGWVLTRHADVLEVLTNKRYSADERNQRRWSAMRARDERAGLPDPYEIDLTSMLRRDPPDHDRLRALVSKAFTPRAIEAMRPRIQARVDALIDRFPKRGEVELVSDYAAPLPVAVIAEMLGVPLEDQDRFRRWSDVAVQLLGDSSLDEVRKAMVAMGELGDYIRGIAEQRRAEPRADLISALVAAEEEGDRLSLTELVSTSILLLIAGNETTTKLISNSVVALLRNPDQLALLRDEPKRIEGAVDELMRYDGPIQLTSRMVVEDHMFRGHRLRAGQQLALVLAAANRDPEAFDDPDRLDVTREGVRHVGFGQGLHFCLGAQLARLETGLALEGLITRHPNLRFADKPITWGTNTVLRGPTSLRLAV
jgi:pimeloyl-[acyl-carrier protein] synthase